MKKILVPIDFSANSLKALDYAVEMAKALKCAVVMLYVSDFADTPFRDKTALETKYNVPMDEAVPLEMQHLISSFPDVPVTSAIYAGNTTAMLMTAVRELQADLIIMGTVGDTGIKEALFGSETAHVINQSPVPVLAVPLLAEWQPPTEIMMAVSSFTQLPAFSSDIFQIAEAFDATIHVVVFTDDAKDEAVDFVEHARGLEEYTTQLKQHYPKAHLSKETLSGRGFIHKTDDYIREKAIRLLVMFPHPHHFPAGLFTKGLTERMAYHTNIPLLSVPAT